MSPLTPYTQLQEKLRALPKAWVVTGGAGFIGSHLVEQLLRLEQSVICLDNFSTGRKGNLDQVREEVGARQWEKFALIEGDISDAAACRQACAGADFVLHQAAAGSVPRSLANPVATNQSNVNGFVTMLSAAKDAGVKRFIYASSSSVYGDHPGLPKVEDQIGNCLSPYAVSKRANELYAEVFARCYGMECVGLRYFNVFGPRQDPDGAYAAVIPKWIAALIQARDVQIYGDGETSRDFCYVVNVIQANLLAAIVDTCESVNQVYNIAIGERTTLNELFQMLRQRLLLHFPHLEYVKPQYAQFRTGDVRHSHADISKAQRLLGYAPSHDIKRGLDEALGSYLAQLKPQHSQAANPQRTVA